MSITGKVSATGADVVVLHDSHITGAVAITGVTGQLSMAGNHVTGPVTASGNTTEPEPIVVAGNTITGLLRCTGNSPAPHNAGSPNTVVGVALGQCRGL